MKCVNAEACQSQKGFKGLLAILSLLSDPSLLHPPLSESLGTLLPSAVSIQTVACESQTISEMHLLYIYMVDFG